MPKIIHINVTSSAWTSNDFIQDCAPVDMRQRRYHWYTASQLGCVIYDNRILTIRQMKFSGFNMVRYSSSITDVTSSCQYGGLFVLKRKDGTQYLKICTDVTKRIVIPYTVTTDGDGRGKFTFGYLAAVFIAFPGYSSGLIDLTSEQDQDCYGTNVAISRGPSCNNYNTIWDGLAKGFGDYEITQCTDLWLMNDIDYFESSPFENCHFVLDHTQLPLLGEPFEMIISALNCATYYDTFQVNSQTSAAPGNMNVEMDIIEEPQNKTSATKVNFTVSLFAGNKYPFKSAELFYSIHDKPFLS